MRVFITGGGSGIGLAVAEHFDALGWHVGLCDISADAVAEVQEGHHSFLTYVADAGDSDRLSGVIRDFGSMGGIDCLISNVGIAGPTANLEDISPADWQQVMQANIDTHFFASRAAIPFLRHSGNGSILLMSSAAGRKGYPGRAPYATSKWALHGLAKTLADELGAARIRANAILPGIVDNERMRRVVQARSRESGRDEAFVWREMLDMMPFDEPVPMGAIASLAAYLASQEARFITGQLIGIGENF